MINKYHAAASYQNKHLNHGYVQRTLNIGHALIGMYYSGLLNIRFFQSK